MQYSYLGQPLDETNFIDFLHAQVVLETIPPFDVVKTNDCVKVSISYNGGWGLGYDSSIKYSFVTKMYEVQFVDDGFSDQGRVLPDNVSLKDGNVIVEDADINEVIGLPFYYGFHASVDDKFVEYHHVTHEMIVNKMFENAAC